MANLYENEFYTVELSEIDVPSLDGSKRVNGYACINKETQVHEYEDVMLPAVISASDQLAKDLEEMLGGKKKAEVSVISH